MKGNEDINNTTPASKIASDLNIKNSNVTGIGNNTGNSNNISINIGNQQNPIKEQNNSNKIDIDGEDFIEHLKRKLKILFIDDDSDFNIVKILKSSGWSKTSSIVDVKNLNMSSVKDSDILFIDIRGVGKAMNLQGEGLDLALIIKQRYPEKKVVIYSANPSSNSFHDAWKIIDDRLMKNALPIEFENIIIEYGKKITINK
jgi:hypothetical protein